MHQSYLFCYRFIYTYTSSDVCADHYPLAQGVGLMHCYLCRWPEQHERSQNSNRKKYVYACTIASSGKAYNSSRLRWRKEREIKKKWISSCNEGGVYACVTHTRIHKSQSILIHVARRVPPSLDSSGNHFFPLSLCLSLSVQVAADRGVVFTEKFILARRRPPSRFFPSPTFIIVVLIVHFW